MLRCQTPAGAGVPQHRSHDCVPPRARSARIGVWAPLGLREAQDAADYAQFHGADRRSPQPKPTSYES